MKSKKSALLVIDMQLVAFDGKITPPIPNGSHLLDNVARLLEAFRSANGGSVVFLQTCAMPGQPYAKDVHGWEIHPAVAPHDGEKVFHKVGPSGFENPGLDEFLKQCHTDEVIVCGTWSEGCVASTCDSALELGYGVRLIGDGHSTVRDSEAEALQVVSEQNEQLRQKNAMVLTTEEMILQLGKRC